MSRRSRSRSGEHKQKVDASKQGDNAWSHLVSPTFFTQPLLPEEQKRLGKWFPLPLLATLLKRDTIVLAGGAVLAACVPIPSFVSLHDLDLFTNDSKNVEWIIQTIATHYEGKTEDLLVEYPRGESATVNLVSIYHRSWACPLQIVVTEFISAESLICQCDMDYVQAGIVFSTRLNSFCLVTSIFCQESWKTRTIRHVQAYSFRISRIFIRLRKACTKGFLLVGANKNTTLATSGIWTKSFRTDWQTRSSVSGQSLHGRDEYELEKHVWHRSSADEMTWLKDPVPYADQPCPLAKTEHPRQQAWHWSKYMSAYDAERLKKEVYSKLIALRRFDYEDDLAMHGTPPSDEWHSLFHYFVPKMFPLFIDLRKAQANSCFKPFASLVCNVRMWPLHSCMAQTRCMLKVFQVLTQGKRARNAQSLQSTHLTEEIEDMLASLQVSTRPMTDTQWDSLCSLLKSL